MTFDEILDHAIAMLQRRRRLTYGTLKRQFQLDEAALEDLKDELIYGQRLAVDEDGRVLVWTGGADVSATPALRTPQPASPGPLLATQAVHPPQAATPQATPLPGGAERRQLTVLFCDLVDSTRLASQLDPEDYRDVVRAYQAACTVAIERYDGHIAQYLGDGLLVYFGYPQAHEDDAQRAVRAGLDMVEALELLNTRLRHERCIQLAVRLGCHTGLVVIGDVGGGTWQEQLALGDTPNVAARLQALAAPDTIVISAATHRLVRGMFTHEDLGTPPLKGVATPARVYRVVGKSGAQSRLEAALPTGLTPLVGREQEMGLLRERWAQAKEGFGQVVVLTGEAGIGKSRLVQVLKTHVADEPHRRWECRGSPYAQQSALYPVIDLWQQALQWQRDDTPEAKLRKLEGALPPYDLPLPEVVPLLASLLSLELPERYAPLVLTPQRQKQKTLEVLLTMFLMSAAGSPCCSSWKIATGSMPPRWNSSAWCSIRDRRLADGPVGPAGGGQRGGTMGGDPGAGLPL